MNLLDENIIASQRKLLARWRPFHQIGVDVGRAGMDDQQQIIPMLHQMGGVTLFTRDLRLYQRKYRHNRYSIVVLDIAADRAAELIRRVLTFPGLDSTAKRMGAGDLRLRVRSSILATPHCAGAGH